MTFPVTFFFHRLRWLNLPGAILVVLLQRLPALRMAATAEDLLVASSAGAVLRSALMTVGSLGALHSLAGATRFVTSPTSPVSGTVGTALAFGFSVTGAQTPAGSYRVTGTLPPGLTLLGGTSGIVNATTGTISGTPTAAGSYSISIRAYENRNATGDAFGPLTVIFNITGGTPAPPAITTQPLGQTANAGTNVTLQVVASGTPSPSYQWQRNGVDLAAGTAAALTLTNFMPADTGLYAATVTNASGSIATSTVVVGLQSLNKLVGSGTEYPDIVAPNGNVYDQILLGGAGAAVTADPGQILRMSFIDLNDDIVQVEFSGAGTLSLVLDAASGPATPVNYNQGVAYMKGHAGIVLAGADETTNLSVFSVGRANAANQALFRSDVTYDGFVDIAFIAITSTNGKFGGLRAANAGCFATKGLTGIYAPGVQFTGPVFIHNIDASAEATPVLKIGSGSDVRITGGSLLQTNGRAVQVSGIAALQFTAGGSSHGTIFAAQANQARLEQEGANVTAQIVVNPAP